MSKVYVNFNKTNGSIRPLNGVNQGPMTKVFTYDAREEFKEMAIPFCRLHDTEYPYGSGEFVDIPCIFKNFDADENDPASYNFGLTDEYISKIIEIGAEPIYRLGVSIEHAPVKRHIFPPKDYEKWTRICEHIIMHYNEGWADGHHWNIRYWEIWNESDGHGNQWLGTPEEFYKLYCVSATYLKKRFPDLKIGGCGWTRAYNDFTVGFLKYISSQPERIPLDFYSWHRYFADMKSFFTQYNKSLEMLKEYGYEDAENVFDEWNYMENWDNQPASYIKLKNYIGAAFCAATMAALQTKTNIALATYFECDVVKEWTGQFDVAEMSIGAHGRKASVKKLPPFYSFKYFGELYRLGTSVETETEGENIYAAAAVGNNGKEVLFSYYVFGEAADKEVTFELDGFDREPIVTVIDKTRTNEVIHVDSKVSDGKAVFTLTLSNDTVIKIS